MEFKTQEEYLLALAEALKYLNPKDATKVLQYYQTRITNAIDYGEKEIDVIKNLPDVETVAKDTYESHGVNYLAMRKKLMKRREVFNNIIGCIISFFILIGFFVIMYFLARTITNMFGLMFKTFESGIGIDKFITPIAVLFYILCVILLTVYVVDLFIILLSNFLGPVIKLKNEDKHRKIFSFTITGFVEDKCNHQKVQMKLLVSFLVLMVICICVSYTTNGYLKHSLNDTPSHKELYTIEDSVKYINIDGYNGNIYFKASETNEFIIEYQYEFKHDFDVIIENNNLSINLEMTKAYDILNFLNEPTQNIVFYIPTSLKDLVININMDESIVDISDITLSTANINIESKGTISVAKSSMKLLDVKGYDINFAVASSNIDTEMKVKTSKGQTLIQQNSKLNLVNINNESSYLKFEDSEIHTLVVENKSGTIDFKNLNGVLMQVNSTRSVNTLNNIAYKELNVTLSSSSKLTISKTYADAVKLDISSSQLVLDYVKGDINILSKSSTLNISGVGSNLEDAKAEYNNSSLVTNLTINNSGNSCKTDIIDCMLNNFSITQDGGFIKVKQSTISEGMVNAANCETIDLIDLSGTTIDLYFSDVAQTIIIDAESKTGLKYVIKVIDTLTFARMLVDEEVIDITNEAVTPNE